MEPPLTCWTMLDAAASGDTQARGAFAETYLGIVRASLAHRWRGSPAIGQVDDAVQEVFLDFFRPDGALHRFDPAKAPNFRTFLFGVVRKVAQRFEERAVQYRKRQGDTLPDGVAGDDATASRVFDEAFARRLVGLAAERMRDAAQAKGEDAVRRVDILRLRFADGHPIRTIATMLGQPPERVHHEYARAREEFKQALRAEVGLYVRGSAADVERECRQLLDMLSDARQ